MRKLPNGALALAARAAAEAAAASNSASNNSCSTSTLSSTLTTSPTSTLSTPTPTLPASTPNLQPLEPLAQACCICEKTGEVTLCSDCGLIYYCSEVHREIHRPDNTCFPFIVKSDEKFGR